MYSPQTLCFIEKVCCCIKVIEANRCDLHLMLKSQNILDAWVLVWGDDVAVFQPDNIRQWVSNGFDSQFNQSALLHTDVPQFLSELWTHQGFLG